MQTPDEIFMLEALEQAQAAFDKGEVPVGAVIVMENEIIARAHNLVEVHCDATKHAEMLCLQLAAKKLGNWRLNQAALYCTLEPCPMCAGAMIHSRVKKLIWAAPDKRCGAHGSWTNILDIEHPIHQIEVRKGVLATQAAELMRAFFRKRREKKEVYVGKTI
jgi:tRNA(adenine34) deaminase